MTGLVVTGFMQFHSMICLAYESCIVRALAKSGIIRNPTRAGYHDYAIQSDLAFAFER